MKPYAAQVQLLGSFAILTLCPDGHVMSPLACREGLNRVLALVPLPVRFVVLDVEHLPPVDIAVIARVMEEWAAEREAVVVALSECPSLLVPLSPAPAPAGLQRSVDARVLVQRVSGIRRARRRSHPCSDR